MSSSLVKLQVLILLQPTVLILFMVPNAQPLCRSKYTLKGDSAAMFTMCVEKDVVNIDVVNIDEIEDFWRKKAPLFIKMEGKETEYINGKQVENNLNFDSRTVAKLHNILKYINHCVLKKGFCKKIKTALASSTKSKVVNISISLEEIKSKYFVSNIFVNYGSSMISAISQSMNNSTIPRRVRRSKPKCPSPRFICHGITKVNITTKKASFTNGCIDELNCNDGKKSTTRSNQRFVINFDVHKSQENPQQSPANKEGKIYKEMIIKRYFGFTEARGNKEEEMSKVGSNIFKIVRNAFSQTVNYEF